MAAVMYETRPPAHVIAGVRVHRVICVRRLSQRLRHGRGQPVWTDDRLFAGRLHRTHGAVARAGTVIRLHLVADHWSRPLDRSPQSQRHRLLLIAPSLAPWSTATTWRTP